MTPQKFYRILFSDQGVLKPFETHQFDVQCDNWFNNEAEAERFIDEHFLDAQQDGHYQCDCALIVAPVYAIRFK